MSFFQFNNEQRGSFSSNNGLQSSSSQRTSYLEETPKQQQHSKDERIRNLKSKLSSIPSQQNNKYDDGSLNIFSTHQVSQHPSSSFLPQNQNINNINLLSNSLYSTKPNQNSFLHQQQPVQQKTFLGNSINMERKSRVNIRGSLRNENEDELAYANLREKNALFFEEDEARRRSITPSQSQSSSNESFYKQQQSHNMTQNQQQNQQGSKTGGFFGNKLQEIKLRRFQIDATKLIIDRLVKISYKAFHDIYEYSLKSQSQPSSTSHRNDGGNKLIPNSQLDSFSSKFAANGNLDENSTLDTRKQVQNIKINQLQPSSSSSSLMRRFEQDICLSDRKQRQKNLSSNNNFIIQTQPSDSSLNRGQGKLNQLTTQQQSLDNSKLNNRKLSIQINTTTTPKPLYRHISPCERQQNSQITRSRNISSIITNNSLSHNNLQSSSNPNNLSSQNCRINSLTNLQSSTQSYSYSNPNQQQNQAQHFTQLSNSISKYDNNLRRTNSQENKLLIHDISYDNDYERQQSTDKVAATLYQNNQHNSLERNTSSYSSMLQMIRQNNSTKNLQSQTPLNGNEVNINLLQKQQHSGNNQQPLFTDRPQKNNNNSENNTQKVSPQRKSTAGFIQNTVSVPKSFLDNTNQRRLSKQSHSTQHLNSYFQTSFFKNSNEESQNSQSHNIHSQPYNQFLSVDKPSENCLSEQSFIRMNTSNNNNYNYGGDLLSIRLNTNESNTNRGSFKENDFYQESLLLRSHQKNQNKQLRQEIENRRSYNNQKQDSLDELFDGDHFTSNSKKKAGSMIEYEEENDMKFSNIQKLKQEFTEIIKFSFQNEIRQPSFKGEEQQKIGVQGGNLHPQSNRVSEKFNTSNERIEQSTHNIHNQQSSGNLNSSRLSNDKQQFLQKSNEDEYKQNKQKQQIQDSFQAQLLQQKQQFQTQKGQPEEKNCISARNNTSAFIVEHLLNQEEVKSFSCYDEELIKQQDLTIHPLSTKNQNHISEFSNFKDELIFDKTVHSFDFNMSLRESENNIRQKINFQQEQMQSPSQIDKIQSPKQSLPLEISELSKRAEQNQDTLVQPFQPQLKKENLQFNGSFGRLSVDSTPKNNEEASQSFQSKRPLSQFARQQSEDDNITQKDAVFPENYGENIDEEETTKRAQKGNQQQFEQNASTKFNQNQQEERADEDECDNESSRFSFELKNTLDEFQTQQHLEQIIFNQNNQNANEDISIIEKNNKSNFSIFIDRNDKNNISIFNSNNEELQNIVTNSQINFQSNNFTNNQQESNILIAQSFPAQQADPIIGNQVNQQLRQKQNYAEVSFDQNQQYNNHLGESAKKSFNQHPKKFYGDDVNQHFGDTKKQLFMECDNLTVSNERNEEGSNNINLMAINNIINQNNTPNEALNVNNNNNNQDLINPNKYFQLNENNYQNTQNELFLPHFSNNSSNEQNQQLQQPLVEEEDDENVLFQANEFTPPRRRLVPVNQYPIAAHAESSPIIDSEIVEGGQGLKIYEFSLKLQGIMRAIQIKNMRESFISIVIFSQLKSYLMSAFQQQQWQQQQQNEQLQAQRVAQIQNIPYYYQSQFSTIFEQQNETCSDIYQQHSMNASRLFDSRSIYDSKNLDQFNLEMNKVTIFNSLQFVQNQLQIASQHISQSSILESNIMSSQNSMIAQPQINTQGINQSEVITELDSNDGGIKQFWALSIISSKMKKKMQNVLQVWRSNIQKTKKNENIGSDFIEKLSDVFVNKSRQALDFLKQSEIKFDEHLHTRNKRLEEILLRQQQKCLRFSFNKIKEMSFIQEVNLKNSEIDSITIMKTLSQLIGVISNNQQKRIEQAMNQLKNHTIHKTKLVYKLEKFFKTTYYKLFLNKLQVINNIKKKRELALLSLLENVRRQNSHFQSKYLERWRMQLYLQSSYYDKFQSLSHLQNTLKSKIQSNVQFALKKMQLQSLISSNKEKFLKNIMLKILLLAESRKNSLKQESFLKIFNYSQQRKQRELVLRNLLKQKLLKEQQKYFHLFSKRVNDNKNHEQFIKTGIKSLLLMGSILQSKLNQNLLSAFKVIQFTNYNRKRASIISNPTIDVLNTEHETIKLTLKSLRNNLLKVKTESLVKGFAHIQQKLSYNQLKLAFRNIQEKCKSSQKLEKGLSLLEQIQLKRLRFNERLCFFSLKSLIQDKLKLRQNLRSQKQIFCVFLKTFMKKKHEQMKSIALQSMKEKSYEIQTQKRDKKLIYTESSMFTVKCKLIFGMLDKVFKKHLYQYPFQLIYGCQSQKLTAALQFYQSLTNPNQKPVAPIQNKKIKGSNSQVTSNQIPNQNQKNMHAQNLLHLSKSKSPLKKIQEQHQVKHDIIKNLVVKNEDSKHLIGQNSKKEINTNNKNMKQNTVSAKSQQLIQNEIERVKPKTAQSQIIPPQSRLSPNQSAILNAYRSQVISPSYNNTSLNQNSNQLQENKQQQHELSMSSKSKCITFGGNSNSPQQNEYNNKSNTSIHNVSSITNFYTNSNSSPNTSDRISFPPQPNITAYNQQNQNTKNNNSNENQRLMNQPQILNQNISQKLPYFQHNRNYSSGNIPASFSQPLTNTTSNSMIFYGSSPNNNVNQFN